MIFATDLDNTMIFSHNRITGAEDKFHCVEYYNGKPITYMSYSAIKMLASLMNKIFIVPATTRSVEQFKRIEFFFNAEYVIADNAGVILHNGIIHQAWDDHIQNILKRYDLEYAYKTFCRLPGLVLPPKIVDKKFVFAKSDNIDLCKEYLKCKLDTKIWQISFYGKKIYAIPIEITKGNALRFICEHLLPSNQTIISAGDSSLDMSMLNYSDYSIIPNDSNLSNLNINRYIKKGEGVYSADEILKFVENMLFKM